MARKAFTVPEANALIPALEDILERLDAQKAALLHHRDKMHVLDALWGQRLALPSNPDHREFLEHQQRIHRLLADIQQLIAKKILPLGVRFPPGGLEEGLIDFPTTYQGRWVYMCWQRGEPQVLFWHEINAGKAGRQEISAEHIIAMGREDDPELVDDSGLDF
jgi:hypothetical protein